MEIENSKKRFILYELGLLSLKAALSTRDSSAPVYAKGLKTHKRKEEKKVFREVLVELEKRYSAGKVTEEDHLAFISKISDEISNKLSSSLYKGRFRIGTAQKLINLHLKYLWAAGFIKEPPHCPIDGIIRDMAGLEYDWTTSDSIEEYKSAVAELRKFAGDISLAVWELKEFRRRDE